MEGINTKIRTHCTDYEIRFSSNPIAHLYSVWFKFVAVYLGFQNLRINNVFNDTSEQASLAIRCMQAVNSLV